MTYTSVRQEDVAATTQRKRKAISICVCVWGGGVDYCKHTTTHHMTVLNIYFVVVLYICTYCTVS